MYLVEGDLRPEEIAEAREGIAQLRIVEVVVLPTAHLAHLVRLRARAKVRARARARVEGEG